MSIKPNETYDKMVPKLKFSHKFLKGKHVLNESGKVQAFEDESTEEEKGSQEVLTPVGAIPISIRMKVRIVANLQASVNFLQKHYDNLRAEATFTKKTIDKKYLNKIYLILKQCCFIWQLCIIKKGREKMKQGE
ncbi:hypothetical protein PVK06_021669 [Gossypium arboreum]|uniref:Uncharacterized protein n=1 Tax=Gossypium arboreum TaxID=29729 RepID=A0ABR0PRD0_GOSAR|nr:hypothetical protein PVK06_021669 [Gossypium arboreum]